MPTFNLIRSPEDKYSSVQDLRGYVAEYHLIPSRVGYEGLMDKKIPILISILPASNIITFSGLRVAYEWSMRFRTESRKSG